MRRTQAMQIDTGTGSPFSLAEMPCHQCRAPGVTILALDRNENGAIELGFCGVEHASLHGWPWLSSEKQKEKAS